MAPLRPLVVLAFLGCGFAACGAPEPPHPRAVVTARAPAAVPPTAIARVTQPEVACEPRTVEEVQRAVLAAPAVPSEPVVRWDRRTPPLGLDALLARYGLAPDELAHLQRDGFVVLGRTPHRTFSEAFWEVHRAELPVYISMDALFHAVYASHEDALAAEEESVFLPRLVRSLDAMRQALPSAASRYPPEVAHDLDLYLSVARELFGYGEGEQPQGGRHFAKPSEVSAFVERVSQGSGTWTGELFGRGRTVDFGQFAVRGHYMLEGSRLSQYFAGTMWLSRMELNVVTRSSRSSSMTPDPRETPREALDAFALSDLAHLAKVDVAIGEVERAWASLAGQREDMGVDDLALVQEQAGVTDLRAPDAFVRIKATIGDRFVRTARTHVTASGSIHLPVTATLLPPRITLDTSAMRPFRLAPGGPEMAYLLGQTRALVYLEQKLAERPALAKELDQGRALLWNDKQPVASPGLYGDWLGAILSLAEPPAGVVPSYMATPAFADLRLDSAIASYGQLRHAHVLIAPGGFDESGCLIPYGYVEPAPKTLDALIAFADDAAVVFEGASHRWLGDSEEVPAAPAYRRMAQVLRVLRVIVQHETEARPLTAMENRFLAQVADGMPASPYARVGAQQQRYDGWYYRMFASLRAARRPAAFVSDYYRATSSGMVAYVGADEPRLGVFVVDAGGEPRVAIGPVARAYERQERSDQRVNDLDVTPQTVASPWSTSYETAALPLRYLDVTADREPRAFAVTVHSDLWDLGQVQIEQVDVHDRTCSAVEVVLGPAPAPVHVVMPDLPCERGGDVARLRLRRHGVVITEAASVHAPPSADPPGTR